MFTITDNVTNQTVTVAAHNIADAITPWFTGAPSDIADDVAQAVTDLQAAAMRREPTVVPATYLDVTVTATR